MVHTDFALRRPVTTLMAFAAVAVIGIVASRLLPLEQYPDVSFPFMGAGVPYPGSTPEETEELITRPIEDALATLPGIEEIRSTSSDKDARFEIRFAWGTDINTAGFEVRNKLDSVRAQLPKTPIACGCGWRPPPIRPCSRCASPRTRISRRSSTCSIATSRSRIERIDGVARVELAGVEAREVRILVDPGRARGARRRHPPAACTAREEQLLGGRRRRSPATANACSCGRSANSARSTRSATWSSRSNVQSATSRASSWSARRSRGGRHLDRPPRGGPRRLQVHAGQRRRSGRSACWRSSSRTRPAADAGHQRVHHRQPGGGDRLVAERSHRAGLIGAALAFVVLFLFLRHWPTTLIVSARGAAVAAGDAGGDVFRRPHHQRDVDDGHDAGHRHAGGQRRGGHRERVPASTARSGSATRRDARRREGSRRRDAGRHRHLGGGVPAPPVR